MTDRPILFSAPMILALLAGRKTQTRRIDGLKIINDDPSRYSFLGIVSGPSVPHFAFRDLQAGHQVLVKCRFAVGDQLWVKESHRVASWDEDGRVWISYDADRARSRALEPPDEDFVERLCAKLDKAGVPTKNDGFYGDDIPERLLRRVSIHMPRWASRLTLTVTDVRVQQLQDISEDDAEAEGIESFNSPTGGDDYQDCWRDYLNDGEDGWPWLEGNPIASFRSLWESINGASSWGANPWCAAISFSVAHRNIDASPTANTGRDQ